MVQQTTLHISPNMSIIRLFQKVGFKPVFLNQWPFKLFFFCLNLYLHTYKHL